MAKYILKRVISVIPVLFIVSIIIFSLIHLTPGDPARAMLGDGATETEIAALQEQMGLNDPLPLQYVNWLVGLAKGDLGESIFMDDPMSEIIGSHMGPTIALTIYALVIAILIAIPSGIAAAKHRGRVVDTALMGFSMMGVSIPSFLLGLLLMMLFAIKLKLFPSSGYKEITDGIIPFLRYLTLPAIALGVQHSALLARMTRSSVLEVLNSDYIKMAKSKGVSERVLLYRHALRSAFVPILTVIGQSFMGLMAGAMITETVFNIPGIGQLVINSVSRRDYEVIQIAVLLITLINVGVMLVLDILYGVLDPRVRIES